MKELNQQRDSAALWDAIFTQQEWGKYPPEDLIQFIARRFYQSKERKAIQILELGCGPGANLWYMAKEGFSVYGIDISEVAIRRAKSRLDQECSPWCGELKVGDLLKLPYADHFFDAVIDIEAVTYSAYERAKLIYQEAARVLKPGGFLYVRTFANDCWGDKTGEQKARGVWTVTEGPLSNKGDTRFTEQIDIPDLLADFDIVQLEFLHRSTNDMKNMIREWSIVGQKGFGI